MFSKNKNFSYISAIFVIVILITYQYLDYKIEEKENLIIQSLNKKSLEIDSWLQKKKSLLEKLALDLESIPLRKDSHLELMNETNRQMKTHSIFSGFSNGLYFDTQGYWVEGFDPRNRPWYIETLENKKTTVSGPMYYNDISGQTIVWWSVSTMLLRKTRPIGVIGSEFLPEMIAKHLKEIDTKNIKNLFLFNSNTGIIVSAIDKENELKYIQDIYSEEIFKNIKESKSNKVTFLYKNVSKKAFISKLKESAWILCAIKE